MREERRRGLRKGQAVFVLLGGLGVFVVQSLTYAADLDNLPASARAQIAPVAVDWAQLQARLQEWTGLLPDPVLLTRPDWTAGLQEVSVASLWAAYLIESAKCGKLTAEDAARVIRESRWTAEDVAAFWDRLDRETADRARRPDVAGPILAAIEQTPHLQDAFGEGASTDVLFGLAQVKLYARKLPEAREALKAVLARLPEKTELGQPSRGLLAYRIAQSYEFASDFETAREWYLNCAEWGTPENTGGYDVRGEGLGEAARMCRRLGRNEEAALYYRRATQESSGWGRAMSLLDQGQWLLSDGRVDEAQAVLRPLAEGSEGPAAARYALWHLGEWAYRRHDDASARGYLRAVVEGPGAAPDDPVYQQLTDHVVERAELLLSELERPQPQEDFAVMPPEVRIVVEPGHAAGSTSFSVSVLGPTPPQVDASEEWATVELVGPVRAGAGRAVSQTYCVSAPATLPVGEHRAQLTIRTGDGEGAKGELPLLVQVIPLIRATPASWFAWSLSPGADVTAAISLRGPAGFQVLHVQSDRPESVQVRSERRDERTWLLWATLVASTTPGVVEGSVEVSTDIARQPELRLPYCIHTK